MHLFDDPLARGGGGHDDDDDDEWEYSETYDAGCCKTRGEAPTLVVVVWLLPKTLHGAAKGQALNSAFIDATIPK